MSYRYGSCHRVNDCFSRFLFFVVSHFVQLTHYLFGKHLGADSEHEIVSSPLVIYVFIYLYIYLFVYLFSNSIFHVCATNVNLVPALRRKTIWPEFFCRISYPDNINFVVQAKFKNTIMVCKGECNLRRVCKPARGAGVGRRRRENSTYPD